MSADRPRPCPICGNPEATFVRRSLVGPRDERDQYVHCQQCGRVTYEILSRTPREVRAQGLAPGQVVSVAGQRYRIRQMLRAGPDEYLVYVRLERP